MIFIILILLIVSIAFTFLIGFIETLILTLSLGFSNIFYGAIICSSDENKCSVVNTDDYSNNFKFPVEGYYAPFENLRKNGFSRFISNIFSLRTPYIYNFIGIILSVIFIVKYRIDANKRKIKREKELIEYEEKIEKLKKNRLERHLRQKKMENKKNNLENSKTNVLNNNDNKNDTDINNFSEDSEQEIIV